MGWEWSGEGAVFLLFGLIDSREDGENKTNRRALQEGKRGWGLGAGLITRVTRRACRSKTLNGLRALNKGTDHNGVGKTESLAKFFYFPASSVSSFPLGWYI